MKTWIEISKKNLVHNLRQFDAILGRSVRLMAVVKSNAYGHGLIAAARIFTKALRGREVWLGVDSVFEGAELREAGIQAPILVLGYTPDEDLFLAFKHELRLTVYNKETILKLSKFKKNLKVHIKLDTGTTRQGVGDSEILDFVKFVKKFPKLEIEGLSTHYANIEDTTDHAFAAQQLKRFIAAVGVLEKAGFKIPIKHTASSAAAILFPETHFNMARIGISLYGYWSSGEARVSASKKDKKLVLKPALVWKTVVAQVRNVPAGTPISYGLTEKTGRDGKIAVLPVGYFDGYDRGLSSVGEVLINGHRAKVMGRVCMNMIMVDATDCGPVDPGEEAVLLGRQGGEEITAEEVARKLNTINYEVVTRINPLIKRVAV